MRKESVILEREKVVEERLEVDDIMFYEVGSDGHWQGATPALPRKSHPT